MVTSKTLERYTPVDLSMGLCTAEEMADIRPFRYSDYFFYVPFVATIYYTHIGISTRMGTEKYYNERIVQYTWMQENLNLDVKAREYCKFVIAQNEFLKESNWRNYCRMFWIFWKSFDRYTLYGANSVVIILMWWRMFKLLIRKKESY